MNINISHVFLVARVPFSLNRDHCVRPVLVAADDVIVLGGVKQGGGVVQRVAVLY